MNHNDQIEEKAARLWQTDIYTKQFWADYTQLLQEARAQSTITLQSTSAKIEHFVWEKILTNYWSKLPHTIHSDTVNLNPAIEKIDIKSLRLYVACIVVFVTCVFLYIPSVSFLWSFILMLILVGGVTGVMLRARKRVVDTLFEFTHNEIVYKESVRCFKKTELHVVQIPYETIGEISTHAKGISFYPKAETTWHSNTNASPTGLTMGYHVAIFNQFPSFIRDVIKANYANRLKQP